MRSFFLFSFISLVLTACGTAASSTPAPEVVHATASPAAVNLGKCVDARVPTPNPNEPSLFPPISGQDHILGAKDAYVTILVYSDFQCASCGKLAALLKSFVEKYPQNVRVVFRHFPLESIHDKAALSAQAAEAAALQGKFWEMHDLLFEKQAEWLGLKPSEFQKWLIGQLSGLGLDQSQFETDLTSSSVTALIQKAWDDGQQIKLPGTPVILVNNEIIKWQTNLLDQLEGFVLLAMLPEKQFSTCPPVVIDPAKQYTATLKTSKGDITIHLFVDKAPNTVNNFIFLAQKGWYDNVPFHRVTSGFVAQTGDPTGTGLGGPGYFIPNEKNTSLQYNRAGMVGMVNSGPDTNGSQFFLTMSPAPHLNEGYTLFGEVISGLEVLSQITPRNPSDGGTLPKADMLISVSIEAK